jgi:ribosome-dependent ATPase
MTQPLLRIKNLSHDYKKTSALDTINLSLEASKTIGFIGPDGVGKSTLLSLICGVKKLQSGEIELFGGNVNDASYREQIFSKIAYMPQGLGKNLYMSLSVEENLEFFARLFGLSKTQRKKRITLLLKSIGLYAFKDRITAKLSGGMKQKLGLCCALIHDPKLLILDEPTTGVDPLSRKQFWELIDQIRDVQKDMSVIVATAYMEEAANFNEIVAMNEGKVLFQGSPQYLLQKTQTNDIDSAFIALLRKEKTDFSSFERVEAFTNETAIEARNLTMAFGTFKAVEDLNIEIKRGEIFGFLGSNGCGKTTTMKMLTGLLTPTGGSVKLFGKPFKQNDMQVRKDVGYMTQSFSLYGDLSVKENLILHAKLYGVAREAVDERVRQTLRYFDFLKYENVLAKDLPLGLKQKLSLGVAVIHKPKMLILDEPTSGVDPVSRDIFWKYLLDLAKNEGVTIFVSTHFMNEGQRCDRISLMHRGKILVTDAPGKLINDLQKKSLQEVFIHYLHQKEDTEVYEKFVLDSTRVKTKNRYFHPTRFLGYAYKESLELLRDPVRLVFAMLGTVILLFVMGYGINMDVKDLKFAVIDYDDSPQSREYIEYVNGSRYFLNKGVLSSHTQAKTLLQKGEISLVYEIPPAFGKDIVQNTPTQVGVWIDGTLTFRAEMILGYVQGLHSDYLQTLANQTAPTVNLEMRYRYNPDFQSLVSIVPAVIPMLLIFIPSILMAVSVVREKELGSITNFYATPVSKLEFLLGKQLPYVVLSMISFFMLLLLAIYIFKVPLKGSLALLTLAALFYVVITTGIGLLFSSFAKTQIAALGATAILTLLPTVSFSGLKEPVSSLEGVAALIGNTFPATYFMNISRSIFNKAVNLEQLQFDFFFLFVAIFIVTGASVILLKKQEA